eukprot:6192991-Pleurochrysis_carterae.AAC.1
MKNARPFSLTASYARATRACSSPPVHALVFCIALAVRLQLIRAPKVEGGPATVYVHVDFQACTVDVTPPGERVVLSHLRDFLCPRTLKFTALAWPSRCILAVQRLIDVSPPEAFEIEIFISLSWYDPRITRSEMHSLHLVTARMGARACARACARAWVRARARAWARA